MEIWHILTMAMEAELGLGALALGDSALRWVVRDDRCQVSVWVPQRSANRPYGGLSEVNAMEAK